MLRDNVGLENFNASLYCKDIDVIKIFHNPGVWVIEMRTENDSTKKIIENIKIVSF